MLKQVMSLLTGHAQASRIRKSQNVKHGNKGMPAELQRRQIELAEVKRQRKMQRANGWFDGGKAHR